MTWLRRIDLFLVAALLVLATRPAQAYLDGNSSGLMAQLLLGGMAGWIVLLRLGWRRVRQRVRRGDRRDPDGMD